ncbi:MAG: ABC transporter ATP-binding protein [Rhodospirillales bacterium]|nr:ABC transporter ATP-binding protein [Rhodospirillales bacterium]
MTILDLHGLTRSFGGVIAVNNLSFAVEAGAIHSMIGPNGAGKTTVFNLITGVYKPSAGRIRFQDEDVTGLSLVALAAKGICRTFQNLQIFFNMTALENVMVGRHRHCRRSLLPVLLRLPEIVSTDAACRDKAEAIMGFVGLGDVMHRPASALPYGALKRLEIARALAAEPKLLLLDEPAAGLNPSETMALDELIREIARSGVTVVLVEHDMRLVMSVSDRILVLNNGAKLAEGGVDEVRGNPDVIGAYLGGGIETGSRPRIPAAATGSA